MKTYISKKTDTSPESHSAVRAAAIKILSRFERSDAYLDKLLDNELNSGGLSVRDKSLLTEIVNGVVRWRWKLDWVLTGFYFGDYLKCLNIVKNAMRTALYQILYLDRVPVHAAINESVEYIKKIQGEKTAGLVNAVLRNIVRNSEKIRYPKKGEDLVYYYAVMYSHPRWMVKRWLAEFGEEATVKLLEANNTRPYVAIRVNKLRSDINVVCNYLRESDIKYEISKYCDSSVMITAPGNNPASFDMFKNGQITIQDTAATLVSILAAPKPGQSVADLCAAPGGKTFAMADIMNNEGSVSAIDKYSAKLRFITDGAERLGLDSVRTMSGNAATIKFKRPFDLVLCDVPCSGTGTISKKPDIKWKREYEDIKQMNKIQKAIIENAAKMVKIGGALVYSTCSIEQEENADIVNAFLKDNSNYEIDPAEKYLDGEICSDGFLQVFPHIHGTDGAFGARLIRIK